MLKKFVEKLRFTAESHDGCIFVDMLLPRNEAIERFNQCVQLHLSLGFAHLRVFRLLSGNHLLYEFVDKRKISK